MDVKPMSGQPVPSGGLSRRAFVAGLAASGIGTGQSMAADLVLDRSIVPVLRPERRLADLEGLHRAAGLSGKLSVVLADADTGAVIEALNPLLALPPASVTKAITAQYGLDALGPDHAFRTRVMATAPVRAGVLDGDLVLAGGGDPTLDTEGLDRLVTRLAQSGLKEVRGRFLVDGGPLPELPNIDARQPGHLGYNPAIGGLNLNFNRVYFEWKRRGSEYDVTMDARSEKRRPAVNVAQMRIVDRKAPTYTFALSDSGEDWTVARAALGNGGGRWLPVRRPAAYAADVFGTLARSAGLSLPKAEQGRPDAAPVILAKIDSDPLWRVLRGMLAFSTNITAEVIGLSASAALGQPAPSLAASAAAMNGWARTRLGLRHPGFVDHSGLGDGSRISARDMTAALTAIGPDSQLAGILKPFALRDAAGKVIEGNPARIRAKTGTLNFASGLAGFITTGTGRRLAFAFFAADLAARAAIADAERERPAGARAWDAAAHRLQQAAIARWLALYAA